MAGPFKMKGWSPFTKTPMHPVIPPTKEQSKKSKGTLKAGGNRTPGFQPKKEWESIKEIWGDIWKRMRENPNPFT